MYKSSALHEWEKFLAAYLDISTQILTSRSTGVLRCNFWLHQASSFTLVGSRSISFEFSVIFQFILCTSSKIYGVDLSPTTMTLSVSI